MMMQNSETQKRLFEKLNHLFGDEMLAYLEDDAVLEIMYNPDGQLWLEHIAKGLHRASEMSHAKASSIIQTIAGIHGLVVSRHEPRLETQLPFYLSMQGERFTAQVPPVVSAPSFTIRKKSKHIFTLDDYIVQHRLTQKQADILKTFVQTRKNILVCGGPGSGKTTFTNALIHAITQHDPKQRILILEDLPELQCSIPNQVAFLTTTTINMTALLRTAMRMRPDRILIGEVRGAECLDMLKAWNTGCPGGICTVHANHAQAAVQRITDLAMEAGLLAPPVSLIEQTVHALVSIGQHNQQKGFVQEILTIRGVKNGVFEFEKLG